jgi:hypothetical protein
MWDKNVNWYVAFISIVFGVFISVWAEPMTATLRLTIAESEDPTVTYLLLARGFLLFLVLVCLWWWYAIFLAKVDPAKGFIMFAYDFLSLGAFSLAFSVWESETIFSFTVMIAAGAVMFRFLLAWRKSVEKEKTALIFALFVLTVFTVIMATLWVMSLIINLNIDPKVYQIGIATFLGMCFFATAAAVYFMEGGFRWGSEDTADPASPGPAQV